MLNFPLITPITYDESTHKEFSNCTGEIYIISGRIYDHAFDQWLEAGHYASRPAGEAHGPFICEEGCLVLEIAYPSQSH